MTTAEALNKAAGLCTLAEYCSDDILKKLARWEIPLSEAYKILDYLKKNRYVDDSRFAVSFVRDKYRFAKWGRRKIALALYKKHLPSDIVADAFSDGIDMEEYEAVALSVLKSKARTLSEANTFEGKTKLFRFAAGRGFEPELVARIIRSGIIFNTESDD